MKQISFETSKGKFLAVKVHNTKYSYLAVHFSNILVGSTYQIGYSKTNELLPQGNYQILSPLSEMNEELWKEVVPNELIGGIGGVGMQWLYPDYTASPCDGFDKSTQSGKSLMRSLGVYLVNPYEKPNRNNYNMSFGHNQSDLYLKELNKWQQAEANAGNWILLKEI